MIMILIDYVRKAMVSSGGPGDKMLETSISGTSVQIKGQTKPQLSSIMVSGISVSSRHGDGSYYFANGDIFTGGWREGRQHGPGYQTFPNGNLLDGSWRNGDRDGVFIFVFPNGARYQTVYEGGVRQTDWTQIDPVPHNQEHFLSRN